MLRFDLNREPDPELDEPPLTRNLLDIMDGGIHVIGTCPSKKSRISSEVEDGDCFSNLPTDIMSCILSRLPTNEAVRTSILSKDWKFKWTCVHNVHMNEYLNRWSEEDKATYINFMYRLLLFNSHNIKSFSLKPMINSPSLLTEWISAVLGMKVENFEISLPGRNNEKEESDIFLPFTLLTICSNSLRKLKVDLDCTFTNVNPKNCFPNLTSLSLCGIRFQNGSTNNIDVDGTVSLTFPVLEKWETLYCRWLNVKIVEIYVPSLIMFSTKTVTTRFYGGRSYLIRLIAPRLVKFASEGHMPENIVMDGGGSQVVSAVLENDFYNVDVELHGKVGLQIGKLLKEFSSLEELNISKFVAVGLQSGLALGVYNKLRRLTCTRTNNSVELVLELLHAAPTLKYLYIDVAYLEHYNYNAMEYIPSCILFHLEEIELAGFMNLRRQNKLAKFLLKNGGELKKLSFWRCCYNSIREKILDELSKFPRKQAHLTFSFK